MNVIEQNWYILIGEICLVLKKDEIIMMDYLHAVNIILLLRMPKWSQWKIQSMTENVVVISIRKDIQNYRYKDIKRVWLRMFIWYLLEKIYRTMDLREYDWECWFDIK